MKTISLIKAHISKLILLCGISVALFGIIHAYNMARPEAALAMAWIVTYASFTVCGIAWMCGDKIGDNLVETAKLLGAALVIILLDGMIADLSAAVWAVSGGAVVGLVLNDWKAKRSKPTGSSI